MVCGVEHDTNGYHLAGFSEDVAFARHFGLPISRSATGIGYASKKLYKMAENSASYSPDS